MQRFARYPHRRSIHREQAYKADPSLHAPNIELPGFTGIIIQINHVLNRLIPVSILPHIHDLHFTNFMNHTSIIARIENGRHDKYGIQHRHKLLRSSHQINQSLRIVKNRPRIMPTVSFGKSISHLKGLKGD